MTSKTAAHRSAGHDRGLQYIFIVFFMLSGASALMYEITWVRIFTKVLGASGYAVTIILSAFMAGLGLGAWFFGRMSDQSGTYQLVKKYVLLEIGIGIYALILPFFLACSEQLYVWFYRAFDPDVLLFNLFKLILSFVLLVIPATFIGGTLPVLSRFIIRSKHSISMPRNTDDLPITEFTTPKQLVYRKKAMDFITPGTLHGDLKSLQTMLKNIEYN